MYEPIRLGRTLARLAAAGLCVIALAALAPADAPPTANAKDGYRDLQLTVHVRRALHEEEALASVNVGVRVRDGVAILWGPVPSAEAIAKAVARAERVQGIFSVRNELYVAAPASDPNARLLVELLLARLSAADRFLLVLLEAEGWSVAEIAERLGWSQVNVKVRAHRARRRLRRVLEEG